MSGRDHSCPLTFTFIEEPTCQKLEALADEIDALKVDLLAETHNAEDGAEEITRLTAALAQAERERDDAQHDLDVTAAQKLDDLSTELRPLRAQLAEAQAEIERLRVKVPGIIREEQSEAQYEDDQLQELFGGSLKWAIETFAENVLAEIEHMLPAASQAEVARLRGIEEAAKALHGFAWSAVTCDCMEAQRYLGGLVQALHDAFARQGQVVATKPGEGG